MKNLLITTFMFSAVVSCKLGDVLDSKIKRLDTDGASSSPKMVTVPIDNNGHTEYCFRLAPYPGLEAEDEVFENKKQIDLCDIRFDGVDETRALCPKTWSTNPAIEVMDISGLGVSKKDYEYVGPGLKGKVTGGCATRKGKQGTKLAKFKGSVSCSSTASILGNYYLGRILGVGDIPRAVLRTIHKDSFSKVVSRGVHAPGLIGENWKTWRSVLAGRGKSEIRDLVLTKDHQFIYGALIENTRGETYHEYNKTTRASTFLNYPKVKELMSFNSLSSLTDGKTKLQSYAYIKELKDLGDMIIIDTLFNQQDRLGNLAAKGYYYYFENGKVKKVKARKVGVKKMARNRPDKPDSLKANGKFGEGHWAFASRLIMKDNDCGLRKNNKNYFVGLEKRIKHLSPKTYKRLRWLAREYKSGRLSRFVKETSFRHDGKSAKGRWGNTMEQGLRDGLRNMERTFYARCVSGDLKLDLDAKSFYESSEENEAELEGRCNLVWNPQGEDEVYKGSIFE